MQFFIRFGTSVACANLSLILLLWTMCSYRGRRKGYCPGQNQGTQRGRCYRCRVTSEDWLYHVWNLQAAWNGRIDDGDIEKPHFDAHGQLRAIPSMASNKTNEATFSYVPSVWKMASSPGSPSNELISNKTFQSHGHAWSQCECLISNFYCLHMSI